MMSKKKNRNKKPQTTPESVGREIKAAAPELKKKPETTEAVKTSTKTYRENNKTPDEKNQAKMPPKGGNPPMPKVEKSTVKRLLNYVFSRYKARFFVVLICIR